MRADPAAEWGFLGPRVLIVSPFPPANDGIGTYAQQLAEALAVDRSVKRVALPGGNGERVRRLDGWLRPLWILREAVRRREVVIQYHPHYFIQGPMRSRYLAYMSLIAVSRLRRTTVVMHEQDDPVPTGWGPVGRRVAAGEEWLRRRLWARSVRLVFHTEAEREAFARRFPARGRSDVMVTHGAFFTSSVEESREGARARLGLKAAPVMLLCIGYLSPSKPDKAYDAAIEAFGRAGVEGAELHVVGSPIARPGPEVEEYVDLIRRLAAHTPGVHLRELFVSDEEFDLWIRAADAVVVPYREATSSGVAARAVLLGTPLIARAVGGIEAQLRPGDVSFRTDDELANAMREFALSARAARDTS